MNIVHYFVLHYLAPKKRSSADRTMYALLPPATHLHGSMKWCPARTLLSIPHAVRRTTIYRSKKWVHNTDIQSSPATVHDREERGESRHAGRVERGHLQLVEALRVPLHGAVGVEQRHGDRRVGDGVVLRPLAHADPHLGAVVLREVRVLAARGIPHAEQARQVDQGVVVHALGQLQPLDVLLDALADQDGVGGQV
jgi:hypothetical protein